MESSRPGQKPAERWVSRQVQAKGLRPRFAAYLIAAIWIVAVVSFGVIEHLVDRETFPNVWLGMWWALQTVTTVGYGDVVPAETAGKVIASFLLLGGLSLLAVVTGVVTSAFVTEAQEQRRAAGDDPVMRRLDEVARGLASVRAELKSLRDDTD
jgi:voltage-gated potassium channel